MYKKHKYVSNINETNYESATLYADTTINIIITRLVSEYVQRYRAMPSVRELYL